MIDTLEEVQKWEWQQAENLSAERLQEMEACQCIQIHYLTEEEIEVWEKAFKPVYDYYTENYGFKYIEALPKNQFH